MSEIVVDKKEMASFYEREQLRITASCGLDSLSWSSPSAPVVSVGQFSGYAIADGFHYFPDPTDSDSAVLYAQLEAQLGKETVDSIQSLAKDLSSLAACGLKNLDAGCAISNLPNFSGLIGLLRTVLHCSNTMLNKQGKRNAKMGHDGKGSPWNLPIDSVIHMRGSLEARNS